MSSRKSITDTLKTIDELLAQKINYSNPTSKEINEPKVKVKNVLKECSEVLFHKTNQEKPDYMLRHQNFYASFFASKIQKEESLPAIKPITMLNQHNISINIKGIQGSIDELDNVKSKLDKLKAYYMANELKIYNMINGQNFFYEDFFVLPLNYINTSPNRFIRLTQNTTDSIMFAVKSQNNYLTTKKNEQSHSPTLRSSKSRKIITLSIFHSLLKKQNIIGGPAMLPESIRGLSKKRRTTILKGFHDMQKEIEGEFSDYEEDTEEESLKELTKIDDEQERERARSEMEAFARKEKKRRIGLKLERNPKVLEVLILYLKNVYFDAEMPFKFKRKKSLDFGEFKYEDQEPRNYKKQNQILKKERNINQLDVRKLDEARENQVLSEYALEYFDFSQYENIVQNVNINVSADEERPDLGSVTLAAAIYKQIKNTSKSHSRWLVLRGFNLYWYRSADCDSAKGIIPLPSKAIKEETVNKVHMFSLQEGVGRNLSFELSGPGILWRKLLANQIAFKYYYEFIDKEKIKPSIKIVNYFSSENESILDLSDINFKKISNYAKDGNSYENKIEIFFDLLIDSLIYHSKLREINLSKCGIGSSILQKFIDGLSETKGRFHLEILNLEKNNINFQTVQSLCKFLICENSLDLKILDLSHNDLYDQGTMLLSETISNRHNILLDRKIIDYCLPLLVLNLVNVKMSDQGFFGLINSFEKISKTNRNKGIIEYNTFIDLNVSENIMTENSLKAFCHLLEEFNGFRYLQMAKCKKIKGYMFKTFVNILKKNCSITYLNYEENEIEEESFKFFFDFLEENFVIKKIAFTIPFALHDSVLAMLRLTHQFFEITSFNDK